MAETSDENAQLDASPVQPLHAAAVYDTVVDVTDDNDAHALIVNMVANGRRVLELGCATGSTTKVLQEMGCTVVAIEIDTDAAQIAQQFAERVIVADLDQANVRDLLGDDTFDVIVAADVLEHLRDPRRVLTACLEHLRPDGEVLVSVPNIAHADVRLSLLRGDFEYQWCGILDETHLRFFTRRSLEAFLRDCGLAGIAWTRTQRAVGETEIEFRTVLDESTIEWIAAQPDADTYQFIVRAVAAPEGSLRREITDQLTEARAEVRALRDAAVRAERLAVDNEQLVDGIAALELMVAELRATTTTAEHAATRAKDEANETAAQLAQVWRQVDGLTVERDRYRASFDQLAGIQDELVAVRRSESYKIGNLLLSPIVTTRRFLRAWRRAALPDS